MCGIAGLINLSGRFNRQTMAQLATAMAETFRYRGPDDFGVWVDPKGFCAFSHRRLSIVDLSPGGHQPMIHAKTGNALTFNGEIYNYQDLRASLNEKGHPFHTASDTEVLLTGLVTEGKNVIEQLDGMFAFAYFDAIDKKLFLARDAFGEKPLYYAITKDWFAFASELQALTVLPDFEPVIDEHRIATYLALQYLPAPLSIYKNAHKLSPGHTLSLSSNGDIAIERYYDFKIVPAKTKKRSLDDLVDELETIIGKTVKTRLISDVPLGAFLSGGVDSSTVVAIAMHYLKRPIKTFSIGFTDGKESEHNEARLMADHLGTDHYETVLDTSAFNLRYKIPRILDEPNGDSSCIPTWEVSRLAREQVTVSLSGDGGDELFGGYSRYQNSLREALKNASNPTWQLGAEYYSHPIMIFTDSSLEKFIGSIPEATKELLNNLRLSLQDPHQDDIHLMRKTDIENYLPGDVLAKVDRMSMQHSLEVRAPLLGRHVADFAAKLQAADLTTPDYSKLALKHLASRYLPKEWLDRPKKGFSIPTVDAWGGIKLAREIKELLLTPECSLASWIPRERLSRFVDYHMKTPKTFHMWPVFVLEQWLRSHPGRSA